MNSAKRSIEWIALLMLAISAIATLHWVYGFSQSRFFTVDEYQYGHATWLVSQGELPYVDFYEHHFPLSYVGHAPLLLDEADFETQALRLRKIVFAYLALLALAAGLATRWETQSAFAGWLAATVPLAFGFSLMTLVDYRADTFGAVLFVCALLAIERNRRLRKRALAIGAGVVLALAIAMTQKVLVQAGGVVVLLWGIDRVVALSNETRSGWLVELRERPLIPFAGSLSGGCAAVGAAGLAIAAAFGVLEQGFEITVLQAIEHERFHAATSVAKYISHFWNTTWWSTGLLGAFAFAFLAGRRDVFWWVAVGVAAAAVWNLKAHHPYNFVTLVLIVLLCAVRGVHWLIDEVLRERLPTRVSAGLPLAYGLPLLLLPVQIGFAATATTNEYQLRFMQKIERYSAPTDAVIDNAGGAMFRPHGSYYYLHGDPHRLLFARYFREELVRDYRESRALFWIYDFRLKKLPPEVIQYMQRHYIRGDGDLFALGFFTPATSGLHHTRRLDVIRAGEYYVHRYETKEGQSPELEGIRLDSKPISEAMEAGRIRLDERSYALSVAPHSPAFIISPLPREFFDNPLNPNANLRYTKIFEYGEKR